MKGHVIFNKDLRSAQGLAIDEALCESVSKGQSSPALHLYNYLPCVIIGRYQNAAACLRLDRCEYHGMEVNRRITGGGTVFMTPDQMAFGLVLPNDFPGLPRSIHGAFEFLAAAFVRALSEFDLNAEFMGKNDLTVNGKKIAGLAISQDMEGVTFFHTSLLLDFDIETMLDILNLPTQRMLDRGISCFGERMTTIRQETKKKINIETLIAAVHRGIEQALKIELVPGDLSNEEKKRVQELCREKYENDDWIYGVRTPKRRTAFAEKKTPGGLIQVHLALSGGAIESIMITGDYFSRTRDIAKFESLLKWTPAKRSIILEKLDQSGAEHFIHKVDLPEILELIQEASSQSGFQ
jgi:lipoate-protein ligase A